MVLHITRPTPCSRTVFVSVSMPENSEEPILDPEWGSCVALNGVALEQPLRPLVPARIINMAAQTLKGSLAQASLASASRPAQQPKVHV